MSDNQYQLYKAVQINAGGVSHDLRKNKAAIESANLDAETKDVMLKVCDCMIDTADELALLISQTAQLIFKE